jgi:GT2 family glycosyltransferase
LKASLVVLSVERSSDLPERLPSGVQVIMGCRGLTIQRNRGLDRAIGNSDIIVFFDDDFVPAQDAIEKIVNLFEQNTDIIAATGTVLQDGVKYGGLPYKEALDVLERNKASANGRVVNAATDSLYGCNMALRTEMLGDVRFDENLPLYAWQEDVDFTGQLLRKGRIVKTTAFAGVHRGVNKGRTPGLALGFSQIVNPIYLVRKGTMRRSKAVKLMAKNFIANHAKIICAEPFIDRVGRSKGNWLGLWHIMRGNCDPAAIPRNR